MLQYAYYTRTHVKSCTHNMFGVLCWIPELKWYHSSTTCTTCPTHACRTTVVLQRNTFTRNNAQYSNASHSLLLFTTSPPSSRYSSYTFLSSTYASESSKHPIRFDNTAAEFNMSMTSSIFSISRLIEIARW